MSSTNKLIQVLTLVMGYLNVFYVAVVGGFVLYKDGSSENKSVAKLSIVVSLAFFAISAVLSFLHTTFDLFNGDFSAYATIISIIALVKFVVFAVLIVLTLLGKLNLKD
ncbi:MAG: hypothetical protein IJZ29_01090 [Clostridia bacterium]|nr:hypothetical protein [Clostridia bacterium]